MKLSKPVPVVLVVAALAFAVTFAIGLVTKSSSATTAGGAVAPQIEAASDAPEVRTPDLGGTIPRLRPKPQPKRDNSQQSTTPPDTTPYTPPDASPYIPPDRTQPPEGGEEGGVVGGSG